MSKKVKTEKLIRLMSDDSAEYMRLRRAAIRLPEAERQKLERKAGDTLDEIKRVLYGERR